MGECINLLTCSTAHPHTTYAHSDGHIHTLFITKKAVKWKARKEKRLVFSVSKKEKLKHN